MAYSKDDVRRLEKLAAKVRRNIVLMVGNEGLTGHLGGSCSSADIVAALYGKKMKLDPQNPKWEGRDKFLYSKGHAAIAQYAVMAELGYFPAEELLHVKELGCMLQGHPDIKTPGIEANTGSLGQGLSIANGMALAMKLDGKKNTVYCLMGDGELAEGQIWEAAMAASRYRLDNIVGILDWNKLQATGICDDRFPIAPIREKWESFGWTVFETDGHDIAGILDALDRADAVSGPVLILADTVKGKGISFAEHNAAFHNGAFTKEQFDTALSEIDAVLAALA